jgi:hypothetical protein
MIGRRAQKIGVKQPTTATGNGPLMKKLQAGQLPFISGPKPTVDIPGGAGAFGGTRVPNDFGKTGGLSGAIARGLGSVGTPPSPAAAGLGNMMKAINTPKSGNDFSEKRVAGNTGAKPYGAMMKKGGKVSSASKRADGCATKGKTRGKIV